MNEEEKKSQKNIITLKLLDDGFVSRNWALNRYITRLANYIFELKKDGWEFSQSYKIDGISKDFVYYAKKIPSAFNNVKQQTLF